MGALREARKHIFPDTCHRLCAWHLNKNACENVENSPFLENFKKAMYSNFTLDEFECFWTKMIYKHGLVGNGWVSKTYEIWTLWVTAYFRDKFFGCIRTTSQCESINSIMKTYVRRKCNIFEFIHKFEEILRGYRSNELVVVFKSQFSKPMLTTCLQNIEKDAAKIYTAGIFEEVKEQIEKVVALIVFVRLVNDDQLILKLTKYCDRSKRRIVIYNASQSIFHCECRLFESQGILCSHIFCVMKKEHVNHIPSSLILTRWTKNAKTAFVSSNSLDGVDSDVMELARFGGYSNACTRFCKVVVKKGHYNEVMNEILKLTNKYEKLQEASNTQSSSIKRFCVPNMVKTKSAPKKSKIKMKKSKHCSRL